MFYFDQRINNGFIQCGEKQYGINHKKCSNSSLLLKPKFIKEKLFSPSVWFQLSRIVVLQEQISFAGWSPVIFLTLHFQWDWVCLHVYAFPKKDTLYSVALSFQLHHHQFIFYCWNGKCPEYVYMCVDGGGSECRLPESITDMQDQIKNKWEMCLFSLGKQTAPQKIVLASCADLCLIIP